MNRIAYFLFLFCLIFAPVAFGTVERWSLVTLETIAAISACLVFLHAWFYRSKSIRIVGLVPLLLFLCLPILQLIPLPVALVKVISPAAYAVYQPVIETLGKNPLIALSVDRHATLQELLRISAYSLFYICTLQLLAFPERLKQTVKIVAFLGGAIAFLAIIQRVSSPDHIFWFRRTPPHSVPFGPWVYVNHFAAFIELVFPIALALFLFYRPRHKAEDTLRARIVALLTMPGVHLHILYASLAALMFLAVFISLSRGGILSLLLALMVFLFLHSRKFPKRGRIAIVAFLLFSIGGVNWFGWEMIFSEFGVAVGPTGSIVDGRLDLWRDTWKIILDFPVLGAGFGSFMAIFPSYKTIPSEIIYDHAHNDYLELITDGGFVAFLLAGWFVVAVLRQGWKMIRARRDQYAILVGIGAISGIVSICIHSVIEFNFHNGAVGLYFFFCCGLLLAGTHCRFDYFSPGTHLQKYPITSNSKLFTGTAIITVVLVVVQFAGFYAGYQYNEIKDIYLSSRLSKQKLLGMKRNLEKAILSDPLAGFYNYQLGSVLWYLGDYKVALEQHAMAAIKNPLEGAYLQQLGLLLDKKEFAAALIDAGFRRAIYKKPLVVNYAQWLLFKGYRQRAVEVLNAGFKGSYGRIEGWLPLLDKYDFSRDEIVAILPHDVQAWLDYGLYCEKNGRIEEARFFIEGSLDRRKDDIQMNPDWFMAIIQFHLRRNNLENAIHFVRQGVEALPNYIEFRLMLGDYYFKQGITYRAKEEYERVLVLQPGNEMARRQLRRMGFGDSY